ncbi:MAG: PP2C family protein-serine/threonine phosphatase [Ruegeria sp.]
MLATPAYDIALILNRGQRDTQEDAVAARVFDAANAGYVVIADGMGGHEAGEVASELVIAAWREVLDEQLESPDSSQASRTDALPLAAMQANAAVTNHTEEQGNGFRMGSTLLGVLLLDHRLFWISIGDSPLFLFRNGRLSQINEDHSLGPMVAAQVADGTLTEAEGKAHPQRNQLTSVIMGGAIPEVDCPEAPLDLASDDVLIMGSDGLQYLSDGEIEKIMQEQNGNLAQEMAHALLQALKGKNDPDQDNISIAVVKPARN